MTTRRDKAGLPDDAVIRPLRRRVLAWYDARRRDLPWRREPTLYGVWISEMMLQQTTVATVVPFWERFVERFPDVASLAAAPVPEVLALWSGLGYYRRANNLHDAARAVMTDHGGRLPHSVEGWRALPGVGAYAAGAIASIGLGLREPAVDANVRRVLTRWVAPDVAAAAALPAGFVAQAAAGFLDPRRPGDWNQALMELGATVCRARSVACGECPARPACRAAAGADPASVGRLPRRAPAVKVVASALVVHADDGVLLLPSAGVVVTRARGLGRPLREDLGGLHQGLFAPPQTPWYARAEGDAIAAFDAAWTRWLREARITASGLRWAGRVRHGITHHDLQVDVFQVAIDARSRAGLDERVPRGRRWSTLRESAGDPTRLPLTTPARQYLRLAADSH